MTVDNGSLNYISDSDIYGFQFNHDGCISSASGGLAAQNGFMVSLGGSNVIGFSLAATFVPAGEGVLLLIDDTATTDCLSVPIFSDANGAPLVAEFGGGVPALTCEDEFACNYGAEGDCVYVADGECDCDGNVDLGCGCGEVGPSGCDETCGSTLEFDECGICGGDGISEGACDCDGNIDLGCGCGEDDSCLNTTSLVDISYCSDEDIYGFQFSTTGDSLLNAFGGDAGAQEFMLSSSPNTGNIIGFSMTGASIASGCGVLMTVEVDGDGSELCIEDEGLVISGFGGLSLDANVEDCLNISYSARFQPVMICLRVMQVKRVTVYILKKIMIVITTV